MKRVGFFAASLVIASLSLTAPATAAHVSCGDTITQSTTLDSDVVCADGASPGLFIGAGNLTLNLNGHAIRAVPPNEGLGITTTRLPGTRFSGVHIAGGAIEGFGQGVYLLASDSSVRNSRITASGGGVTLDGDRNLVLRNMIEVAPGGASDGVAVLGLDAYLVGNTVRGAHSGVSTYGNNPRIVGNTVQDCGDAGVRVGSYTTAAVIVRNNVAGCAWDGIFAIVQYQSPGGARLRSNVATGNDSTGIAVKDPGARLLGNTANRNGQTGIYLDVPGSTVTDNTANDNAFYGITGPPGTIDGGGNRASGNSEANCVNVSCTP